MTVDHGADAPEDAIGIKAAVLNVLREVCDTPCVTLDDNFFDLGGNSTMVIEVVALLKERHGIRLRARQFIEDPVVSAIVASCQLAQEPG